MNPSAQAFHTLQVLAAPDLGSLQNLAYLLDFLSGSYPKLSNWANTVTDKEK
jgi:hypothetical protein